MALPVALQLYSVRDELEADFEGTIAKVKEFGYDGVEFAGLYGKSAEQVKKILGSLPFRLMFRSTNCSQIRRRLLQHIRK
jgi:sugar phosphate isomerase/epimerase